MMGNLSETLASCYESARLQNLEKQHCHRHHHNHHNHHNHNYHHHHRREGLKSHKLALLYYHAQIYVHVWFVG
jgi:hypothetical protein